MNQNGLTLTVNLNFDMVSSVYESPLYSVNHTHYYNLRNSLVQTRNFLIRLVRNYKKIKTS